MTLQQGKLRPRVAILIGDSAVRIWGMSARERLLRQLKRAGVAEVRDAVAGVEDAAEVLLFRLDHAFEQRLVDALVERPGVALVAAGETVAAHVDPSEAGLAAAALEGRGALPPAIETLDPEGLGGSYDFKLRKREVAYAIPLDERSVREVEDRSFAASYKGVTDFVTKYWWPKPAQAVTKWCAERAMTPNQITYVGFALVIAAFWLFWTGHYIPGLIAAWIMTFLDTVDGKLARVTMTSSKFGNVLDHGIDLIHPPFWWWAWIIGLPAAGFDVPYAGLMIWIVFGGYVLQRIAEGVFVRAFGMHMHVWRRFDSFFRLITARRNPNLVILTPFALIGRPDVGMILVCAWVVICLIVHVAQVVQAGLAVRRGPIVSWLDA